ISDRLRGRECAPRPGDRPAVPILGGRGRMRLYVHHRTEYRFSEPQARLVQLLRLTPGSHIGQNVVDWRIDVDCNARLRGGRDGYGNETTMLYVDGLIESISIAVDGSVLTEDKAGMVRGAAET